MSGRQYSDELRGAVMAALLTGQSVSSIAREYNIPKGTVGYWSSQIQWRPKDSDPKRNAPTLIGAQLLDYLTAALCTLKNQVEAFGDADWLKKQSASEVAVLHGVIADKTVRLLEGLAAQSETEIVPADE